MAREDEQGLRAEFADCLRREQSRLYGYIHSLVRDLNDADDLFQQTTLILWKKFGEFDRRGSFFAWACGIARFEVANFLRGRSRQRLYFSDELNLLLAEAQAELTGGELDERRDALAQCIEKLRQRDRELLEECYGESSGVHEAAGRRGRSPQSVYNSLRRIRRALFECVNRTLVREETPGWAP
ncbi:MAG TPA: sigma-70 family RNA polymerase sigma factor [Gemmataceae bacterium]